MAEDQHFGRWFRRIREKLGLSRQSMAAALGLESEITISNIEKRPDKSMRGTTTEALLDMLGYRDELSLDVAWKKGAFPDLDAVKSRLSEAQAVARDDGDVSFDAALTVRLFHWLAAHPPRQMREILRAVPKPDANTVLVRLAERVAEPE